MEEEIKQMVQVLHNEGEYNFSKYVFPNGCYISTLKEQVSTIHLTQEQVLALAYLRKLREQVADFDKTLIITIEGKHRSGKSIFATTLGYLWDKQFPDMIDQRICHTPKMFIDALETIEHYKQKVACIIIDEAGASVGSDAHMERWMRALEKAVMIIGWCNPIIIFLSPIRDFVSSKMRKMSHIHMKIERFTSTESIVTPYECKWSTVKQKYFFKHPILHIDGQRIVLERLHVKKPPDWIIRRYQIIENKRKPLMLDYLRRDVIKDELEEAKTMSVNLNDIVNYVKNNLSFFKSPRSKRIVIDENLIKYAFPNLTKAQLRYVRNTVEKEFIEKID